MKRSSLGKYAVTASKYIGDKIADNLAAGIVALILAAVATGVILYQERAKILLFGLWPELAFFVAGAILGYAIAFFLRRTTEHQEVAGQWDHLTPVTGMTEFEERNEDSPYMPKQIIGRPTITSLSVMANGCSKWTRLVAAADARNKFKKMVEQNREIRFLASCPIHLSQTGDAAKVAKSIKNAKSLILLRGLREETGASPDSFEIRTYKHTATLRLIIIDGKECVVGHYKEGGDGDSLLTPLLIFECNDENEWGFGHAFFRLFNSEWARSCEPTSEEWKEIEVLASKGSPK